MFFFVQSSLFAINTLIDGGLYYIQLPNQKYFFYDENKDEKFSLGDNNQKTIITLLKSDSDKIFLKLPNSKYIGIFKEGELFVADRPADWEKITVEEVGDDIFYLKSIWGTYLSANNVKNSLVSTAKNDQSELKFIEASDTKNLVDNSNYYIKGPHDSYVAYTGSKFRLGNYPQKTPFKLIKNNENKVIFQLPDNKYLGARNTGGLFIALEPRDWEAFDILESKNGKFYIKSVHKTYLSADTQKQELTTSPKKGELSLFELVSEVPKIVKIYESSKNDLVNKNIGLLEDNVKIMDTWHWTKDMQNIFKASIAHYKDKMLKNFSGENFIVVHNDNYDIPTENLRVQAIYNTKIIPEPGWMVYSANSIADEATKRDLVITYLDYANASLGGHLFGGGSVQEERMFAQCIELALYSSGNNLGAHMIEDQDLTKDIFKPYTTRSTRDISNSSPRPKYIVNVRCGVNEKSDKSLTFNDQPPLINILALAAPQPSRVGLNKGDSYTLELVTDFFNNVYKAFDLVQEFNKIHHPGMGNLIVGGLLGAGVFGNSALMSAAMQIMAARLLGIDELLLTAGTRDLYGEAIDTVNSFLTEDKIGWKFSKLIEHFFILVKDRELWKVKG